MCALSIKRCGYAYNLSFNRVRDQGYILSKLKWFKPCQFRIDVKVVKPCQLSNLVKPYKPCKPCQSRNENQSESNLVKVENKFKLIQTLSTPSWCQLPVERSCSGSSRPDGRAWGWPTSWERRRETNSKEWPEQPLQSWKSKNKIDSLIFQKIRRLFQKNLLSWIDKFLLENHFVC